MVMKPPFSLLIFVAWHCPFIEFARLLSISLVHMIPLCGRREKYMKIYLPMLFLLILMTTGCATSFVRSLGRTTVFEGPRVVIVWTNGQVGVKDVRYTSTEPTHRETIITQRHYRVPRQDMIDEIQRAGAGKSVALNYEKFPIPLSNPLVSALDAAETAGRSMPNPEPGVVYAYCLSKGFGGVDSLAYPGNVRFAIGSQFSQKVGEYRTTWGKLSQPFILIAIPIDIVTSPIQAIYFLLRMDRAWEG
jgi:hypothetical protein